MAFSSFTKVSSPFATYTFILVRPGNAGADIFFSRIYFDDDALSQPASKGSSLVLVQLALTEHVTIWSLGGSFPSLWHVLYSRRTWATAGIFDGEQTTSAGVAADFKAFGFTHDSPPFIVFLSFDLLAKK